MHQPAVLPVRVVSSVLRVVGIVCTIWRIYFRLKIRRFWWEDAWATVALLSCLASLVGEWVYLLTDGLSFSVGYWFYTLGYPCVVRAGQLSILFSIIRIPCEIRLRKLLYFYATCCGVFWVAVITERIWRCTSNPSWRHYPAPICNTEWQLVVFSFSTDCFTVGVLIASPLCVLWRVKLPRRQRRMILSIFASSVVLAVASIFHVIGSVYENLIILIIGVDFEAACAIIMCNLLVVVTYTYRFLLRDSASLEATTTATTTSDLDSDSDDFTLPTGLSARSPLTLTTVEIWTSATMSQRYTARTT